MQVNRSSYPLYVPTGDSRSSDRATNNPPRTLLVHASSKGRKRSHSSRHTPRVVFERWTPTTPTHKERIDCFVRTSELSVLTVTMCHLANEKALNGWEKQSLFQPRKPEREEIGLGVPSFTDARFSGDRYGNPRNANTFTAQQ